MKTGLFGGDWEDFIQPVNDYFDNAINQIQSQGAHGELARMQAMDDALGVNAGNGIDHAGPGLTPLCRWRKPAIWDRFTDRQSELVSPGFERFRSGPAIQSQ